MPTRIGDLDDEVLLEMIAKPLAESDIASAVAFKRCSRRFKNLATKPVADAVKSTNENWRAAAASIGSDLCPGAAKIRGELGRNEVLKTLDLSGKKIDDEGAAAIAGALRGNAVLTHLDLGNNGIRHQGAAAIAEALRGNGVLTNLDLGWNEIGDEGVEALAFALRVNGVLKTLNLSQNQLCGVDFMGRGTYSVVGITALAEALKVNGVMTELDVSWNSIGPAGAAAIAEALRGNEALTNLNLSYNGIRDEGAAALGKALEVNGVLKSIDLRSNRLGDEGERVVRDAVSWREGFKLREGFGRADPGRRAARRDGGGHDGHRGRHHAHAAARQLLQAAVSWLWRHERVRQ